MNAFDKNNKSMPQQTWGIKDTQTGLWVDHYSININFTSWSNESNAVDFGSETNANNAISAWGETPGLRYIGSNPPHPPK